MTSYCAMYVMAQFCHYSTQDLTESIASLGLTQATSKKENETIVFYVVKIYLTIIIDQIWFQVKNILIKVGSEIIEN